MHSCSLNENFRFRMSLFLCYPRLFTEKVCILSANVHLYISYSNALLLSKNSFSLCFQCVERFLCKKFCSKEIYFWKQYFRCWCCLFELLILKEKYNYQWEHSVFQTPFCDKWAVVCELFTLRAHTYIELFYWFIANFSLNVGL